MTEQAENIEVVKKGYQAFADGDLETMMDLFDDDIEWVQPGQSALSGSYHGKAELSQYFAQIGEKRAAVKPLRFFADGDTVVALSEVTLDDETASNAEVYIMRGGKTVRVQLYGDTAMLERVYGKKQVAAG